MNTTIESTTARSEVWTRPTLLRRALAALAVASCLPYLALKTIWLTGGSVGLDDPELLHGPTMWALNLVTFLLDAAAIALALAFVTRWGRHVPAPVILVPMWVGSGLLGGVLLALPLQLVLPAGDGQEPRSGSRLGLEPWVYQVVYAGFAVLGLALLAGFGLYARERWSGALTGRLGGGSGPEGTGSEGSPGLSSRGPGARDRVITGTAVAASAVASVAVFATLRGSGTALTALPLILGTLPIVGVATVVALRTGRPTRWSRFATASGWFVASGALGAWGGYLTVLSAVPNPISGATSLDAASLVPALAQWASGCLLGLAGVRALRSGGLRARASGGEASGGEDAAASGRPIRVCDVLHTLAWRTSGRNATGRGTARFEGHDLLT